LRSAHLGRPRDCHLTLSALEAEFLHLQGPFTPISVGSLAAYDAAGWRDRNGHLRLGALRAHIEARLATVPRVHQRIVGPPGHVRRPRWEDDPDFNIDRHVLLTQLPPPGDDRAPLALTADLQVGLLDRDGPGPPTEDRHDGTNARPNGAVVGY